MALILTFYSRCGPRLKSKPAGISAYPLDTIKGN